MVDWFIKRNKFKQLLEVLHRLKRARENEGKNPNNVKIQTFFRDNKDCDDLIIEFTKKVFDEGHPSFEGHDTDSDGKFRKWNCKTKSGGRDAGIKTKKWETTLHKEFAKTKLNDSMRERIDFLDDLADKCAERSKEAQSHLMRSFSTRTQ